MSPDLQAELFRRYLKLFRKPGLRLVCGEPGESRLVDSSGPIDEWGIECGDGWFVIVDRLSRACEQEIDLMVELGEPPEMWPRVVQIKEKLGTLRFYVLGTLSEGVREQIGLEHSDDGESARTCASCGGPRGPWNGSIVETVCDACARK